MRFHAVPPALLAIAIVATPSFGQSNAELMTSDKYTRSHDYDLIHQRIALSHFNWDSSSFDGVVTTTLVAKRAGLAAVVLDEGRLLINSSVIDRARRTLVTHRSNDSLTVEPAKALKLGDTLVFTVTYHGKVHGGHGLTFLHNDGLPHRPDQIWSQGEDSDNRYWFPTYDSPNDKATWEMVATVPKGDLAISNGRLVSNVVSGNNRTMTWSQTSPASTYLVSLVVAPLVLTHDNWRGIPVDYYTYPEDSVRAWPLFHVTVDMIDTYSRLTGVRYPWAKYAQSTVADFFGGMENVSATTLVDWLPDARAYRDRPWYQHILIPHELAHQWFGDYVTTANWANMWLNEGFAEFMPGQYWNQKRGARAEQDYYVDEYRQYLGVEGQRSMPLASLGSNNIYPKGALVIKMLKDYLGPDKFWASVHAYLTKHAYGNATSDDMRQAVLSATGENLDWFWNEWIYAAGHPKLVVTSAYDSIAHRLTLNVQQTQVDSFKPDSTGRLFSVPQAFRMPISIRVGQATGDITHRVELNARQQVIAIDSVRTAPTMVIFDEGNRLVKELTFDQPVSWLALQLSSSTDLWNRAWAIDQLAHHRGDPEAARALADAAVHADYFLTRVDAVTALGENFPAVLSQDAVLKAMHDTSAAVRTAAVTAIMGDSGAVIARKAFHGDSSDEVRAAALRSAFRIDRAHARDLLGEGLAIPSYRDVVLRAALEGVALSNDTSFTDKVDASVAVIEDASHVLGILGARGNLHAMSLISSHLNDPRAGVRRWAFNAFSQTMIRIDRTMVLEFLQQLQGQFRYDDVRQQAAELLAKERKPQG